METPLLQLRVDHMAYPGGEAIIRDFSIEVLPGQIISIVGASGAGKTTLLRVMAGLETGYSGQILFDGIERRTPGPDIQIVFQDHRLLPWLRVSGNVAFALNDFDRYADARVSQALTEVGMADKMRRWPARLSGGEEQRVALARVIVRPPRLLLLDEPLRNLDLISAGALLRVIERIVLTHHIGIVLVSHNIEDAVALSDAIYVVAGGPLRIHEVINNPIGRPRDRASTEFASYCAHVIRALRTAEPSMQKKNTHEPIQL